MFFAAFAAARRAQPADRRPARADAASRPTSTRTSSASTRCSATACACALRRRRRARRHRGPADDVAVAVVAAVPQQPVVRHPRRPVRRRRRLLRLRAAVPRLRARLAVRRHGARADDHACSPTCSTAASCSPRRCRRCARRTKGHIAVLLAVLAALKAADYWVTRYETTNERRGFVQGATYAVVNAQLPALMLLMLVALLDGRAVPGDAAPGVVAAAAHRLGAVAVVLIVGGQLIYPAARAVARRQPEPAVAGGAVHRPQRPGDARGDGHQPDDVDVRRRSRSSALTGRRRRGRPRAAAERAPAQPERDAVALPHRPRRRRPA